MEELESRLNKNSRNSDKPPSSDGLNKPKVNPKPAFTRRTNKKRGGQKNHKGKTLELVETPDQTVKLLPTACPCGHQFNELGLQGAKTGEIRQVFDLPPPKLIVTEYQKLYCSCPKCGIINSGLFPNGVNSRVQYGSGVRALTVLLNIGNVLPIKKIKTLFRDIYGYAINESTITTNNQTCYDNLEESEACIKAKLSQQFVNHGDETGIRVAGALHWLHVCCSTLYTFLFVHTKKGFDAIGEKGKSVLANRTGGYIVHDCLPAYFKLSRCKHALCGAHIIRELTALEEQGSIWAYWFRTYLLALLAFTRQNDGVLSPALQIQSKTTFAILWRTANKLEPFPQKTGKRGRPKATKGRNLLNRLGLHQEALLAFAFQVEVPFTNNQAERDLRPIKSKLKVAGCFRTLSGAERHARIFGFISTARKNQINVFKELKNAFEGHTFLTNPTKC